MSEYNEYRIKRRFCSTGLAYDIPKSYTDYVLQIKRPFGYTTIASFRNIEDLASCIKELDDGKRMKRVTNPNPSNSAYLSESGYEKKIEQLFEDLFEIYKRDIGDFKQSLKGNVKPIGMVFHGENEYKVYDIINQNCESMNKTEIRLRAIEFAIRILEKKDGRYEISDVILTARTVYSYILGIDGVSS